MVRILGQDVCVYYDTGYLRRLSYKGCANNAYQEIHLDPSLPEQNQEETFIHEILEYITGCCDIELEHSVLSTLSSILYQVINDNSAVFNLKLPEGDIKEVNLKEAS
jgi:hypothetical protein